MECELNVHTPGESFLSIEIRFIVGSSNASLSESNVNSGTGDPLDRLTAVADLSSSNSTFLVGSLTLSSFSSSDNGLRLGCEGRYIPNGGGTVLGLRETVNLKAAGKLYSATIGKLYYIGLVPCQHTSVFCANLKRRS